VRGGEYRRVAVTDTCCVERVQSGLLLLLTQQMMMMMMMMKELRGRLTLATEADDVAILLPVEELRSRDTRATRWRLPVPWRHRSTVSRQSVPALNATDDTPHTVTGTVLVYYW